MSIKTAILYSTVDGQTLKISNVINEILSQNNHVVRLISFEDFDEEIEQYDKIIIGASIRYGKHNSKVVKFINAHQTQLDKIKNAFFSVNLVARKEEKSTPETNPYVVKFFKGIDWRPNVVGVFAGKIDYKIYSTFDRLIIQLIMLITKGPTDSKAEIEYTDWGKVKLFADKLINF